MGMSTCCGVYAESVIEGFEKTIRTTRGGVEAYQEAVADMFLLSETQALIGSFQSTYTETAYLIAKHDPLFLSAGDCYANCQQFSHNNCSWIDNEAS